jgi:aspartate/methionine/tyrosine aminotransferase
MTALMIVAQMLIDSGDNLVIVAPIWPNIAAAVTIMGGEPRLVALDRRRAAGGGSTRRNSSPPAIRGRAGSL